MVLVFDANKDSASETSKKDATISPIGGVGIVNG